MGAVFAIGLLIGLFIGIIFAVYVYMESHDKSELKHFRRLKLVGDLRYDCYQLYVSDVIPEKNWQDLERRLNEIGKDLEDD